MTETETLAHRSDKQQNENATPKKTEVQDDSNNHKDSEVAPPVVVVVWKNIIKMSFLHIGALYGLTLVPSASGYTLAFAALCYYLCNLGICAGVHRLWSHRSYKASFPLRVFLAICQTMAFQNHIYEWARDHRVHHKHSETNADPHNALRGFFFCHMGWVLCRKHPDVISKGQKLDLSDLKADKVVMFQKRYYFTLVFLFWFLMPTVVPWYFWGESLVVSSCVAVLLRYILGLHTTWLVNSAAHMWGNKPYDKSINPAENLLVSVFVMGEGFHNYHHTFPYDYSASELPYWINSTTAFIDLMCFLGLASDRKRVSKEMVKARMQRTGATKSG